MKQKIEESLRFDKQRERKNGFDESSTRFINGFVDEDEFVSVVIGSSENQKKMVELSRKLKNFCDLINKERINETEIEPQKNKSENQKIRKVDLM